MITRALNSAHRRDPRALRRRCDLLVRRHIRPGVALQEGGNGDPESAGCSGRIGRCGRRDRGLAMRAGAEALRRAAGFPVRFAVDFARAFAAAFLLASRWRLRGLRRRGGSSRRRCRGCSGPAVLGRSRSRSRFLQLVDRPLLDEEVARACRIGRRDLARELGLGVSDGGEPSSTRLESPTWSW